MSFGDVGWLGVGRKLVRALLPLVALPLIVSHV